MNVVRHVATVICLVTLTCVVTPVWAQENMDARALVRKIETQYQGESSHSMFSMKIVTDAWARELSMESWSEGRDGITCRKSTVSSRYPPASWVTAGWAATLPTTTS